MYSSVRAIEDYALLTPWPYVFQIPGTWSVSCMNDMSFYRTRSVAFHIMAIYYFRTLDDKGGWQLLLYHRKPAWGHSRQASKRPTHVVTDSQQSTFDVCDHMFYRRQTRKCHLILRLWPLHICTLSVRVHVQSFTTLKWVSLSILGQWLHYTSNIMQVST